MSIFRFEVAGIRLTEVVSIRRNEKGTYRCAIMKRQTLLEIAEEKFPLPKNQSSPPNLELRLNQMISYAIDRHDWYEDQRGKLFHAALGMLGFIAASAAILHLVDDGNLWFKIPFGFSLIALGTTSIRLIYLYTEVSEKNHPYRKISDIRSWYFRYVLGDGLVDDLDAILCDEDKQVAIDEVAENFKTFLERFKQFYEGNKFIFEDLQQVYIIFILQKYRQENLKKMYQTIKCGSIVFGAFGVLSIIVSAL